MNIWGPSGLKCLVDAMSSFIPSDRVDTRSLGPMFSTHEPAMWEQSKLFDPFVLVDDGVVKISAIILPSNHHNNQILSPLENLSEERIDHRPATLGSHSVKKQPAQKHGDISVVYVCELPEIEGKFDLEKAKALGIDPG